MNRPETRAFEVTTEIVVSKMSNSNLSVSKDNGILVGEYFQEIYKKVLEVAKDINE